MFVEVTQYAQDSFKVLAVWQDPLDNVLMDHNVILTDDQINSIKNGSRVWINSTIVVQMQKVLHE